MFKSIQIASPAKPLQIHFAFQGEKPPKGARGAEALSVALATPGFKGEAGECTPAGARDLVVGLGDRWRACAPPPRSW
jgi:hypothetical protein